MVTYARVEASLHNPGTKALNDSGDCPRCSAPGRFGPFRRSTRGPYVGWPIECSECQLRYELVYKELPMNQPQYGNYAPQPQGQYHQPQQGYQQPQQPQQGGYPPAPTGAAASMQQGAMQQIFNETANQPIRTPINREKPHDSENVVQIKHSELKSSQKDARMFLLIEYTVVKSTCDAMVGREYGYTLFLSSRPQLQELSDLAKWLWGQEAVKAWAAQNVPFMDIAASVGQNLTGKFAKLQVRRNTKNGSIAYEEAFPNHTFSDIGAEPPAWQPPPSGYQPQSPQQGMAPQGPGGYGTPPAGQMPMPGGMPPQQPQGAPQPPPQPQGPPQQPQGAPQQPPQAPGAALPPPQGAPQPQPQPQGQPQGGYGPPPQPQQPQGGPPGAPPFPAPSAGGPPGDPPF